MWNYTFPFRHFHTPDASSKFRYKSFECFYVIFFKFSFIFAVFVLDFVSNNGIVYFLALGFSTPFRVVFKVFHPFQHLRLSKTELYNFRFFIKNSPRLTTPKAYSSGGKKSEAGSIPPLRFLPFIEPIHRLLLSRCIGFYRLVL